MPNTGTRSFSAFKSLPRIESKFRTQSSIEMRPFACCPFLRLYFEPPFSFNLIFFSASTGSYQFSNPCSGVSAPSPNTPRRELSSVSLTSARLRS